MDKKLIISYAKKLKLAILVLIIGLVGCGFLINYIVPKVKEFIDINKNIKSQTKAIEDNEKKLENLKTSMKEKAEKQTQSVKEFYKPIETGLDAETVMSEAFGDILTMLRDNSVKARSVKYDYNPSDDKFVKNASNKYYVCSLKLETIATYKQLQSFLRDLYKHEHFLEISDIEIYPYQKDKKILLAKVNLKLYSQKSEGAVDMPRTPEPVQQSEPSQEVQATTSTPAEAEPAAEMKTPPPGDVPDIR